MLNFHIKKLNPLRLMVLRPLRLGCPGRRRCPDGNCHWKSTLTALIYATREQRISQDASRRDCVAPECSVRGA